MIIEVPIQKSRTCVIILARSEELKARPAAILKSDEANGMTYMRAIATPVIHSTVVDDKVSPLNTSTALAIPSPPVVSMNVR